MVVSPQQRAAKIEARRKGALLSSTCIPRYTAVSLQEFQNNFCSFMKIAHHSPEQRGTYIFIYFDRVLRAEVIDCPSRVFLFFRICRCLKQVLLCNSLFRLFGVCCGAVLVVVTASVCVDHQKKLPLLQLLHILIKIILKHRRKWVFTTGHTEKTTPVSYHV